MMSDSAADATDLYQPDDRIALRMGLLAATRVTDEPLRQFRQDLYRLQGRNRTNRYFLAWDAAIAAGPEAVRTALIEPSERGQVMRSLISFRAFVSKSERDAIFDEIARTVTARWPSP